MNTHLELAAGRALQLGPHTLLHLRVLQGRIWLTRTGDPSDHFVSAGDDMLLDGDAGVVIESDGNTARISLHDSAAQRPNWRQTLWWRVGTWALSHLQGTAKPAYPPELLALDDAQLRDVGAPPRVRTAARLQRLHTQMNLLQAGLSSMR
jgi:hypothetical protein